MPITLPIPRQPQRATPRLMNMGAWQSGGADQFVERLGTRWALDVVLPSLKPEPDGRIFGAALARAHAAGDSAIWPWPQPGLELGTPGTPLVNGAGQAGRTLVCDGFTAGFVMRAGRFFNVIISGRRYLYQMAADATANGSGGVSLPLTTMLRAPPGDNAVIDVATPVIEGRLKGHAAQWTLAAYRTAPISFSIEELGDDA
ncbi:MAG: hypothetical protein KGQ52_13495 [Alphaproteobacteria bacterium]|nr:hypothetical protein [Alphaproteobacteria bacterium]